MNAGKVGLVAQYEYLNNLKRKSFLFTAFILPLIIVGSMAASVYLTTDAESNLEGYDQVGYVDQAGVLAQVDPAAWQPDDDEDERDLTRFTSLESVEAARAAYDAGTLQAYFIIPEDYRQTGQLDYFSDQPIPAALQSEFEDLLLLGIVTDTPSGVDLDRLLDPMNTQVQILGESEPIDEDATIARFLIPIVFAMLFGITVLTTSQFLMSGVVEEKENRIAEILLTSATPTELMLGKLSGLGALALTQVLYIVTLGIVAGLATGRLDLIGELNFHPLDLLLMAIYFLLSFILFSSIMLGIGAAVSAEQESRQFAVIFNLLFISPVYAIALFIDNPQGPIPIILSLFPFTAPLTNLFLLSMGAVATWQVIASLTILVITIVLILWAVSKIFRRGILMYDQRLSLKQLRAILNPGRQ